MSRDARSVAVGVGTAATVATFVGVVTAAMLAPWFSWRANALSDLGVTAGSAALFNGALLVGGVASLPYAWALWDAADGADRAVPVGFAATALLLAGVGAFPADTALHAPVAIGAFLGITATLAVDGALRRDTPTGRVSAALAVVHLGYWLLWGAGVRLGPGLAIPELVGSVALLVWVVTLSPVAPLDG
ncbi:DUF998 domain-containing protein [Halobaculum sp. D14]|uniref:DUF998 domain-containing protein n=1 Tax=unclassified Halobaculum TaxID=2640896 RepID=UPI003EC103C4